MTGVTLNPPSPASPQPPGTSVTWTASASGGSGTYEYRFWTFNHATGVVTMVKDYTVPGNSYTWDTTGLTPGTYYVAVWARSAGSTADVGSLRVVGALRAYRLHSRGDGGDPEPAVSRESADIAGTSVTWTASASGGSGTYEYRFWTFNHATGVVTMVKDYTVPGNSYTWDTTGLTPGTYSVAVWARSAGSTANWKPSRRGCPTFFSNPTGW